MSSREIAELCKKRHPDVRRDVRAMMEGLGLDVSRFARIYTDTAGREQGEYTLPKDLTFTLVAGYNVQLRKRIIDRWIELEAKPLPNFTDPAEAAIKFTDQYRRDQQHPARASVTRCNGSCVLRCAVKSSGSLSASHDPHVGSAPRSRQDRRVGKTSQNRRVPASEARSSPWRSLWRDHLRRS